jgi:Fe-S-cluster-containing dehydrogenase component
MDESRRKFLKRVGVAAVGAGCAAPLLGAAGRALQEGGSSAASTASAGPAGKQWGLVIDIQKCLRPQVRDACAEACRRAHNVPKIPDDPKNEVQWIWSETYQDAFPDEAHPYAARKDQPVLVLCNHCTHPPCVKVCPTEATWKRASDGVVMMDMHRCIGCRYCIAACPYGARSFNWKDPRPYLEQPLRSDYPTRTKGVVEKCTFCEERLREGKEPACVAAARDAAGDGDAPMCFGDLTDPESEISKLLREKPTICRKFGLGTGPNVFYIA